MLHARVPFVCDGGEGFLLFKGCNQSEAFSKKAGLVPKTVNRVTQDGATGVKGPQG